MRHLSALLFACLVPSAALADPGVTAVDDEPTSHEAARHAQPTSKQAATAHAAAAHATPAREDWRDPPETGQLRSARVEAPTPTRVDVGPSVAREHDVAPAQAATATATDGDVMEELAARQLDKQAKRHQRQVDACIAAAHKRAPAAAGSLTLDFDISDRKVQSIRVGDDDVHDATLAACVTQVARSFNFAIATAHLRWPVAVR